MKFGLSLSEGTEQIHPFQPVPTRESTWAFWFFHFATLSNTGDVEPRASLETSELGTIASAE